MSPEQASGQKVDHRTDIFTAGVILYAMCTGRKPFRADDTAQLLKQIREVPPTPPRKLAPELSESLERVILKAMAKAPDARFYTSAEFLQAVDRTPEAKRIGRPRTHRGASVLRVALALAVVGLVASGMYTFHDHIERWVQRRTQSTAAASRAEPMAQSAPAPAVGSPKKGEVELVVPQGTPAAAATHGPVVMAHESKVAAPAPSEASPEPDAGGTRPVAPEVAVPEPVAHPDPQGPAPEPVAQSEPTSPIEPPTVAAGLDPTRAKIDALVEAGNLAAAEQSLRSLLQANPRTAWAHLALGDVYLRKLWRADAVKAWEEALRLDPDLRHDKRLGGQLCAALGPKWQGAGAHLLTSRFGDELIPTLERCLATVDDYPRLQLTVHLLERSAGRSHVDRALVALRTLELAPRCDDRRSAVRILARLSDTRAAEVFERLRSDPCLAEAIPTAPSRAH
jgi:hypothetical protein